MRQLFYTFFFVFLFFTSCAFATKKSDSPKKVYDPQLAVPSVNDVQAFVYQWYGSIDHQAPVSTFKSRIAEKPTLIYTDMTVKSFDDFKKRYKNIKDTIQHSAHRIESLTVSGNAQQGYKVIFVLHWTAKTYDKKDINVSSTATWLLVDNVKNGKHTLVLKSLQSTPLNVAPADASAAKGAK